uniref:Uncharacterized protein n=1 Tax=Panagrolaimus sp. ES5 TaxID=591445 RepID=A0AC34GL13_9BILA
QQPYRRHSRILPQKRPSLLRRDSYYYKKCDICLNEIRPDGYPCYACNSVNTYRNNPRMTRRISRSDYLQTRNNVIQQQRKPKRIPSSTTTAARLPSQPPPLPPPVTIEPYFEQVQEEESGETSSNSSAPIIGQDQVQSGRPYPSSTGWQAAATIPPRTPSQNDFFRDQRFRFSTSPRRQASNIRAGTGVLNAEGLQKHP